jgi:hypothetical protein
MERTAVDVHFGVHPPFNFRWTSFPSCRQQQHPFDGVKLTHARHTSVRRKVMVRPHYMLCPALAACSPAAATENPVAFAPIPLSESRPELLYRTSLQVA